MSGPQETSSVRGAFTFLVDAMNLRSSRPTLIHVTPPRRWWNSDVWNSIGSTRSLQRFGCAVVLSPTELSVIGLGCSRGEHHHYIWPLF